MKFKKGSILGDSQYGKKILKFKKIDKKFLKNLNLLKGQALHAIHLRI